MLNVLWLGMIVTSVICGAITGRLPEVVAAVTDYANTSFELALSLTGILVFWLGLMQLAKESGLIQLLSKALRPVMRRLFPEVPLDHPAMGMMLMNVAANMLGLGNAATPFGLRAMRELEKLNQHAGTASNAMCTFLAINTSSITIIPTSAIAFLAAAGSKNPTIIIGTALFATSCSTAAAVLAAKFFEKLPMFQIKSRGEQDPPVGMAQDKPVATP